MKIFSNQFLTIKLFWFYTQIQKGTENMVNNYFDNFIYGRVTLTPYDFRNKDIVVRDNITYMLLKTLSMFKYNNLPKTIPTRTLELYLQINGSVGIYKYKDELYALQGGLGGEPDYNYMPTIFTVANPALKLEKNLKISEECVIIPNDDMYFGIFPLIKKYATALAENELSLFIGGILSRIPSLISASDDSAFESAKKFLKDIEDGKLGAIADSKFLEGIKALPVTQGQSRNITQLIEYEQYLRAGFFNEIGLNANYNMKRESINSNESQLNDDMLYPMIDNMFKCRKEAIEQVNEMYGTDISVELNSSWEDNYKEKDAILDNLENEETTESNESEPSTENGEGDKNESETE